MNITQNKNQSMTKKNTDKDSEKKKNSAQIFDMNKQQIFGGGGEIIKPIFYLKILLQTLLKSI